ncbi:AAA family ATPase [Pseudomonas sp. WS 5532]|jgi:ABC-2 type transport system ATP-binding protein|nr:MULTISPECIES: AAA family ATPase [unclassified Pseudomonas]MCF5144899.1 AAA family ATPase [Pseudomonas sp. PA-6-3C]MCF5149673.1 AAA family ATPase [Pseudomonas sp. PA-6-3F]MCF5162115.1 AAA family ATPase [Pseudomonas sp. PA-6-2E]MCF5177068.1 AAA family ATPase [Pseudomonas sp. PA-6-1D]MCF5195387.1 AAA family ATPase [Pseudomonas sp. PA-6-1H]
MKRLIVNSLDVRYERHTVFNKASMVVEAGSISGLLGPNGSGKTTFFDVICRLKKMEAGEIVNSFSTFLYLSQVITTPPVLRMFDVFKMMMIFCADVPVTQKHALEKIEMWSPGVAERYCDIWNKKSSLCSYGEKRWFFTLSLLAVGADLVILDEPTAGVDPEFRYHIWRCLEGAAQQGVAVLVSSHNVDEIVNHCDDFYMLSQQRFNRFTDAGGFMGAYDAKSLDEAFIHAASLPTN